MKSINEFSQVQWECNSADAFVWVNLLEYIEILFVIVLGLRFMRILRLQEFLLSNTDQGIALRQSFLLMRDHQNLWSDVLCPGLLTFPILDKLDEKSNVVLIQMCIDFIQEQEWWHLWLSLLSQSENESKSSHGLFSTRPRVDIVIILLIWRLKIVNNILWLSACVFWLILLKLILALIRFIPVEYWKTGCSRGLRFIFLGKLRVNHFDLCCHRIEILEELLASFGLDLSVLLLQVFDGGTQLLDLGFCLSHLLVDNN